MATILGLLLVTSFISQFVLVQLPNQMQQYEFNHMLQVENQLSRLQSTVLMQAQDPQVPISLVSPVTLGSQAVPPFAPESDAWILPESHGIGLADSYALSNIQAAPPNWSATPGCASGNTCSGTPLWDNITGTAHSSYTFTLSNAKPSFRLNFTGNNDTITITWTGASIGFTWLVFNGSFLHVSLVKSATGGTSLPGIFAFFYGQHDVLATGLSGTSVALNDRFVGFGQLCPNGNLSKSDRFYWNATGDANSYINTTWSNSVGYTSASSISLGSGTLERFLNVSTFPTGCAFTLTSTSQYSNPVLSGVQVHLDNRYIPTADLLYEDGAVLISHPGLGSIMVGPPPISLNAVTGGYAGNFTFVNVVGNLSVEEGTETAGVLSRVVSVQSFNIANSPSTNNYLTATWLNLTTYAPYGWSSFFQTLPSGAILGNIRCTPSVAIHLPNTCLIPPANVVVTLSIPIALVQLTETIVTVQLTLA